MDYESEKQTRKRWIDPLLRECRWTVYPFTSVSSSASWVSHAVEEYPAEHDVDLATALLKRIRVASADALKPKRPRHKSTERVK